MASFRTPLIVLVLTAFIAGHLPAQKKKKPGSEDEGYIPIVLPEDKKKKNKEEERNQTLPPTKELPSAVVADTDRLTFQVSPLSGKGLLSQQAREGLRGLLRSSKGTIVKVRAFVAGSGDLRRIGELVGETFSEKKMALPALTVVQVGALPIEGAQVVIETTEMDKKTVNPNGVAFLSGQSASSASESIEKLKTLLRGGGMQPEDALTVTCFVSSLEQQRDLRSLMSASFPNAATNFVQMQREPVTPAAECEGIARVRTAPPQRVNFLNPPNLEKNPNYSQMAIVNEPKLLFTGTQLAFGREERDLKLAFDRLQKILNGSGTQLDRIVASHFAVTSTAIIPKLRSARSGYYNATNPPASTLLPFEGLPSLDASIGVDVVAPIPR